MSAFRWSIVGSRTNNTLPNVGSTLGYGCLRSSICRLGVGTWSLIFLPDVDPTLGQPLATTSPRWAKWRWSNVGLWRWANNARNEMPTLAQRMFAIWEISPLEVLCDRTNSQWDVSSWQSANLDFTFSLEAVLLQDLPILCKTEEK